MASLENKIADRSARVGILGLGYVGLPLAMAFARKGFRVTGFDVDAGKVSSLNRGRSYIPDVPGKTLSEAVRTGAFKASSRFDLLRDCDAVVVCVPTPLRKTKEPDVSFIQAAAVQIGRRLRRGQLVILESTTYPGTTREFVLPLLERGGAEDGRRRLAAGKDFHRAVSPERIDPGNRDYGIENTPKVIGGLTPSCGRLAAALYAQVAGRVVPVSNADAAEMVKLLENTFRAVNIALVNEMALMCHRLGLDVWEIIAAAATKPFGFMPFYPGPGLGGHCIPVDPGYLAWRMRSLNFEPRFIDLATSVNSRMPEHVIERAADLLNAAGRSVKGSRILVLGVAYKAGVGDVRESPALDVIELLRSRGASVRYHDPFVPSLVLPGGTLRSARLTAQTARWADLAVVLTAHRGVDYPLVLRHAGAVFDTRNAVPGSPGRKLARL